jgi:hypothetical protein
MYLKMLLTRTSETYDEEREEYVKRLKESNSSEKYGHLFALQDDMWGKSCQSPYKTITGVTEYDCMLTCETAKECKYYTHYTERDGDANVCELSSHCEPIKNESREHTYTKKSAMTKQQKETATDRDPEQAKETSNIDTTITLMILALVVAFLMYMAKKR